MMRELFFEKKEWEKLREVCEEGYPREVCGLLFGKPGENKVLRVEALENILQEKHAKRLKELVAGGCQIKLVQVYTVARRAAEAFVTPLEPARLDPISRAVAAISLPVESYYGPD